MLVQWKIHRGALSRVPAYQQVRIARTGCRPCCRAREKPRTPSRRIAGSRPPRDGIVVGACVWPRNNWLTDFPPRAQPLCCAATRQTPNSFRETGREKFRLQVPVYEDLKPWRLGCTGPGLRSPSWRAVLRLSSRSSPETLPTTIGLNWHPSDHQARHTFRQARFGPMLPRALMLPM